MKQKFYNAWKLLKIWRHIKSRIGNIDGGKRRHVTFAGSDENAHGSGENFSSREIIIRTYRFEEMKGGTWAEGFYAPHAWA